MLAVITAICPVALILVRSQYRAPLKPPVRRGFFRARGSLARGRPRHAALRPTAGGLGHASRCRRTTTRNRPQPRRDCNSLTTTCQATADSSARCSLAHLGRASSQPRARQCTVWRSNRPGWPGRPRPDRRTQRLRRREPPQFLSGVHIDGHGLGAGRGRSRRQ